MSEMCVCGSAEGTSSDCERCELLRMGGVLAELAIRLANRLEEIGERVELTSDEAGALFRRTAEEAEQVFRDAGIEPIPNNA